MEKIKINTEFITLGQLLKITTIASSGGMAKMLLTELTITVDNELENRRGKKLYPGTVIKISGHGSYEITK
ncbi:MAG: S4 domain-containing protein YaaA [bacterium]